MKRRKTHSQVRRTRRRQVRRTRRSKMLHGGKTFHAEVRYSKTDKGVEYKKDLRLFHGDPLLKSPPEELKTRVDSYFKNNGVMTLQNIQAYAEKDKDTYVTFIRVKIQSSLDKAQNSKTLLTQMTAKDIEAKDIEYEGARFTADGNLRIDIPTDDTPADNITEDGIQTSLGLPEGTKINVNKHKNKTTIVIDFKEQFVNKLNEYKDSVRHHYAELPALHEDTNSRLLGNQSSSSQENVYNTLNFNRPAAQKDIYANLTQYKTPEYASATQSPESAYVKYNPHVSPEKEKEEPVYSVY